MAARKLALEGLAGLSAWAAAKVSWVCAFADAEAIKSVTIQNVDFLKNRNIDLLICSSLNRLRIRASGIFVARWGRFRASAGVACRDGHSLRIMPGFSGSTTLGGLNRWTFGSTSGESRFGSRTSALASPVLNAAAPAGWPLMPTSDGGGTSTVSLGFHSPLDWHGPPLEAHRVPGGTESLARPKALPQPLSSG
jgi:hypothetical protein